MDRKGSSPNEKFQSRHTFIISVLLIILTFSSLSPVLNADFIEYDDQLYVYENNTVLAGLTWDGFKWAFSNTHAGFWHPLTWLSHMLDCRLFGPDPRYHHLINLLFHAANTVLLFLILKNMTGALRRSAVVALLFAIHPLHVESVAWISERKDVLSIFFWMLTTLLYVRFIQNKRILFYFLMMLSYILGLMAKPMLVTLPFVLLLMDYWPLRRIGIWVDESRNNDHPLYGNAVIRKSNLPSLILEKSPFFALSAGLSLITYFAQKDMGALLSLEAFPADVRFANALVSYITYLGKTIYPLNLAVPYPHAGMPPFWKLFGSTILLAAFSYFAVRKRKKHPYFLMGWLWYLGTLVPVIGLVQVGTHGLADRYTYVPLVGIFIIFAWGLSNIFTRYRFQNSLLMTLLGLSLIFLMTASFLQARLWQDSVRLFGHTLKVSRYNPVAHKILSEVLSKRGRIREAIPHYIRSLDIHPKPQEVFFNIGVALGSLKEESKSILYYEKALRVDPYYIEPRINLGAILLRRGNLAEATDVFRNILKIDPNNPKVLNNLGIIMAKEGRLKEASDYFKAALSVDPGYKMARFNLDKILSLEKKSAE